MKFVPYKKTRSVEKATVSVRLDTKTVETLDTVAEKAGISRNELINQCIDYSLQSNRKSPEENKTVYI